MNKPTENNASRPAPWTMWAVDFSLLVIMASLVLPLFHMDFQVSRIVLAAGAGVNLIARLFQAGAWRGREMRERRLHRLEFWSAIFFCAAVVFAFLRNVGPFDWLAFVLAGAAVVIYTSLALRKYS